MIPAAAEVDLPAGRIRYREFGEGEPIVFVHGYLVDGRLWDGVVERLCGRFRCFTPDWPFGAHRTPMNPDADLSPPGIAALIASFLDALDLENVTVVGNDSGGAMTQILATRHPERIGRLVLTNCDTHENFPPGFLKAMPFLARLPGGMSMMLAPVRIGALKRASFRAGARTPISEELMSSWTEPAMHDREIRRDLKRVTAGLGKRYTLEAAEELCRSGLPILLAWAPGDYYFPISYAERFSAEGANARLVTIPGSKTFVPIDQPRRLAEEIARFSLRIGPS